MNKVKHLAGAIAAAVVTAAVAAGSAGAGAPVVNELSSFTSDPYPETWCGQVDGTAVDTVVEHFLQDASGNVIDNFHLKTVFTATATGKSLLASVSSTTRSSGPIDNGDGTYSFITQTTGLVLKWQIPDGPMLKAADGEPLRSAGILTTEDVFSSPVPSDETYITTNESFHGPHLFRQGVDVCGPAVAYLLGNGSLG